jgi:DNA repair protein RecO (recombination protein O)
VEVLRWLDDGGDPRLIQRYFELHLLDLEGYRPQLYRCIHCDRWVEEETNYFDISEGGVLCPSCASTLSVGRRISVAAQKVIRFLQRSPVADCQRLRLKPSLHDEIEHLAADYIRYIAERPPRSRRFVEAVGSLPVEA